MPYPVLSTYRLQLSGAFTFADAVDIVDYIAELGCTHLYLSPVLTAAEGSSHGYDVTDPTTVSAELGGPEGFARLARAAEHRGLGLVVDIVPNHAGVDPSVNNPWWRDVLRHGRDSRYASFFDIDFSADPQGRIVLPVLGCSEDLQRLTIDGEDLALYGMRFPIAPGTATEHDDARAVHDRQHYRLVDWRTGVCGYRRFFSVTSLAGLRQEDPAVFDVTHAEVARWFAEGLVDGVRVDHPDGLTDPSGYLTRLRATLGPRAWVVIEKILAPGEPLDPELPIQGTTGYDALREIGGLFVDPSGAGPLSALAESAGFDYANAEESLRQLKIRTATAALPAELDRLRRTIERDTGTTHPELAGAIAALLAVVGVYRCDYRALSQVLGAAMARTLELQPDLAGPLQIVSAALAHREPAARLQQLCGAMTAKAVEDCYFYRAQLWPAAMTTLSTHDTKRGEDVRARITVLSQVPGLWSETVSRCQDSAPSPDPATGLFLLQNIFGVWPADGEVNPALRRRLHDYTGKAIRESGLRTSWAQPDQDFEHAVHQWLDTVLDGPPAAELTALLGRLLPHAHSDALGQKLLALTVPGVPDVYQGTELWEDSLVDPDNRRPVDYGRRRAALHRGDHPKLRVVAAALAARRDRPETFTGGGYEPVLADGPAAGHLVGFRRGADVLVAVSRWTIRLTESGWGPTVLRLPPGTWTDRLTGAGHAGSVTVSTLFAKLPVVLLERDDG